MTIYKRILLIIVWFICIQIGRGQTLYPILFAATHDPSIGSHMDISFKELKDLMLDIEDFSSYTVDKTHYYSGTDFTLSNLKMAIQTINPEPDDAIIFWYIGHGFIDKKLTTPNLMVLPEGAESPAEQNANSINLQEVYDTLADKCKFVWVVGDACNSDPTKALPVYQTTDDEIKESLGKASKKPKGDLYHNYQQFMSLKSEKLFQSSLKGKSTWSSDKKGSFYTRAFLRVFTSRMKSSGIADIHQFRNEVNSAYEKMLDAAAESEIKGKGKTKIAKPGFFKRIAQFLFEGKANKRIRKRYKKILEDGSLEELGNIIPKPGIDESALMSFLEKRPTTYYLTRGVFAEFNAQTIMDSAEVAECYCTANAIMDFGINTDKEYRLLRKIERYNANNGDILGMNKAKGKKNWLRDKCKFYKDYLSRAKDNALAQQDSLQEKKQRLEDNLKELKQKQIELAKVMLETEKKISQNDTTISITYKQWQGELVEVHYSISKIPKDKQNQECLASTIRKLQQNIPLTENCELILAEFITVEPQINKDLEINAVRKAKATGYELSDYCTNEIKNATDQYLQNSLKSLIDVPNGYRAEVEVKLQLKGNADAKPCRGAGCSFVGTESATYSYANQLGENKDFTIIKGRRQRINNEQLAVARALCAQNKAKEILNGYGISDIKYELLAEVHSEEGWAFRGVDMDMDIKNQFKYYSDRIDNIEAENVLLRAELEVSQEELDSLELQAIGIEKEIEAVDKEFLANAAHIFDIEEQIKKISEEGIKRNLERILKARGYSDPQIKKALR